MREVGSLHKETQRHIKHPRNQLHQNASITLLCRAPIHGLSAQDFPVRVGNQINERVERRAPKVLWVNRKIKRFSEKITAEKRLVHFKERTDRHKRQLYQARQRISQPEKQNSRREERFPVRKDKVTFQKHRFTKERPEQLVYHQQTVKGPSKVGRLEKKHLTRQFKSKGKTLNNHQPIQQLKGYQ